MKTRWLGLMLLVAGCANAEQSAENRSSAIPEGTCLQLAVRLDRGFSLDGQPVTVEELGPALARTLETGNRTAIVDVTCGEGVGLQPIRALHEIMLEQGLHRIQYFHDPDPPIPYVLPTAELKARLAELSGESRCVVELETDGSAHIEEQPLSEAVVQQRLESNPGVVFVVRATDEVQYSDFFHALGWITGAGAQRLAVDLRES